MAGKNIVTLNGRLYDAFTGEPITSDTPAEHVAPAHHAPKPQQPQPKMHRAFTDISGPIVQKHQPKGAHQEVRAHAVHKQLQKSQTLRRDGLQKPIPTQRLAPVPVEIDESVRQPAQQHRSPAISKFGPAHKRTPAYTHHTQAEEKHQTAPIKPEAPIVRQHPVAAKALAKQHAAQPAPRSPKELKDALIKERLAEAHPASEHHTRHRRHHSQPRLATIFTSSLALLLLAGYITYINLPNISMRVAAVRAGVAANYPNYSPDGYHFSGPIAYQPGEVSITFQSNTNSKSFHITQKESSWDSKAVLDNYVVKQTGTYLTYQEQGLTIYSFGNKAAWVNGGLLYTIDGDAPLSSEQLLNIASSM